MVHLASVKLDLNRPLTVCAWHEMQVHYGLQRQPLQAQAALCLLRTVVLVSALTDCRAQQVLGVGLGVSSLPPARLLGPVGCLCS